MSSTAVRFQARQTIEQVEEGNDLAPKFDDRGLITVVTTDADSGELTFLEVRTESGPSTDGLDVADRKFTARLTMTRECSG